MDADRVEFTLESCQNARHLLNWAQMTLARAAGVEVRVVIDFERGRGQARSETIDLIKGALKAAGVEFTKEGPRLISESRLAA